MSKTALITGISGQDGAYLAKLLLEKGYKVYGGERRSARSSSWRLKHLGIENDIEILDFELCEFSNIIRTIEKCKPDEVYNLAAQSFVAASFEIPTMTGDSTGLGVCRVLEAIKTVDKSIKFYQASSSEMFGKVVETPQNENTPFYPRSPYAVAKLYGHWITKNYRESYDMFACSGILFNHESPLRGEEFVTRKITKALSHIKLGKQKILELGNIEAKRDWGFAGDYVEGMHLMLNHRIADDYVLSTNSTYTVRKFIEICCKKLDIELAWEGKGINETGVDVSTGKKIIKINPKFYRPAEVDLLIGDSSKAQKILGWQNKTTFEEMIDLMIDFDLNLAKES